MLLAAVRRQALMYCGRWWKCTCNIGSEYFARCILIFGISSTPAPTLPSKTKYCPLTRNTSFKLLETTYAYVCALVLLQFAFWYRRTHQRFYDGMRCWSPGSNKPKRQISFARELLVIRLMEMNKYKCNFARDRASFVH